MKINLLLFFSALLIGTAAPAQSDTAATGFDGDNLYLPGVLEVFKASADLEAFIKALNSADSEVNNLDLNQDGEVDFITIRVENEQNNKAVILSVAVNASENQDVAIIAMELTAKDEVRLEIIGNQDVYGEQKIYEPADEVLKGGSGGPACPEELHMTRCNVYRWRCVNWMYGAYYIAPGWAWSWGMYPSWWARWQCRPRNLYHARCGYWGVFYNPRMVIQCRHAAAMGMRNHNSCAMVQTRTAAKKANHKSNAQPNVEKGRGQSSKPKKENGSVDKGNKKPSKASSSKPSKPSKTSAPKVKQGGAKPSKKSPKPNGGSGKTGGKNTNGQGKK